MSEQAQHGAAEAAALTWYHTIELPPGILTSGEYDTRAALAKIPFPGSLTGQRCLDVGTHDGFWAFEMERRGAAEVVAIDVDDPRLLDFSEPGIEWSEELLAELTRRPLAFECARGALRSQVARRDLSVYSLSPDDIGLFDFAFLGTLLLHLRDPVNALTAVRRVLRPGGRLLVNDEVSLGMTLRHPHRPVHSLTLLPGKPFWWIPNLSGLRRYLEKAGFRIVDSGGPYFLPKGPGYRRPRAPRTTAGLASRIIHDRGMVHGWVLGDAP